MENLNQRVKKFRDSSKNFRLTQKCFFSDLTDIFCISPPPSHISGFFHEKVKIKTSRKRFHDYHKNAYCFAFL